MSRIVPGAAFGAVVCLALDVSGGGCVQRPVAATEPVTRTSFTTQIAESAIDKVDLLFDIDNSASMGDKQTFLARAIPDLITRLVTPNCVDANQKPTGQVVAADGTCSVGKPEFAPVHDMHIGIVSSSLGSRLGNSIKGGSQVCPETGSGNQLALPDGTILNRHNDDQGHLLDRSGNSGTTGTEADYEDTPLGAADPGHFLDWVPGAAASADAGLGGQPAVTSAATLQTDFEGMVVGVHQFGCGVESQLESWYRFLVQPDPYATLAVDSKNRAQWQGVDTTLLAQRAAFLRPDSLVAVIVLTDENDSEVDVRALGGLAWQFMRPDWGPPRGTSACASNPNDPNCTSCAFTGHESDPACKMGSFSAATDQADWGENLNLRHVHEKQKYGVDVQFPIKRYVNGLTATKVPDRDGEYPVDENGDYPASYQGFNNPRCTNPLFAAKLPAPPAGMDPSAWKPSADELCVLPPGTRGQNLVFYAHIGGVPHQLLQNPDGTQKDTLAAADWKLILGNDPETFDTSGIDPHMVESFTPRTNVQVPPGGFAVADPASPPGTDPICGREWITNSTPVHPDAPVDLEYACTFPLTDPATGKAASRNCDSAAILKDPTLNASCDCIAPTSGSFTPGQVPAVCNPGTPTMQDFAKAYPTIRELLLAKLLGEVDQANEGIVSSLCPIHTVEETPGDPLFGYRPAMNSIVNSLRKALAPQCLPERLAKTPDADGGLTVPCLILGTFPPGPDAPQDCSSVPGYGDVDPEVLAHFKSDQHARFIAEDGTGADPSTELTCQLDQLPANTACDQGTDVGWCYVDDGSHQGCPQAVVFTPRALVKNVVTNLQCLEASKADLGDAH